MGGKVTVRLDNPQDILNRILDDKVGLFAAETVAKYMKQYVPMDSGTLAQASTKPWEVSYNAPYAHYQYEGKLYVDPVYKKGAFYNEQYGFWSRPGVEKEPTDIDLNYSKEKHPNAQSHWDEAVKKNNMNDIAAEITAFIRGK